MRCRVTDRQADRLRVPLQHRKRKINLTMIGNWHGLWSAAGGRTDMPAIRPPNENDILALAQALADAQVEYAVIGGAAMALHGFARMTKDIDLLLPVSPGNNVRLLKALESMPATRGAVADLRPEWMDKGFSTALESEIYVDLLYVAASTSFEELRQHIQTIVYQGVPVVTLDVDGLLITKRTTRESDVPDRIRLERLRNAQRANAKKD